MSEFYNLMLYYEFEIRFYYPSRCLTEHHEELKEHTISLKGNSSAVLDVSLRILTRNNYEFEIRFIHHSRCLTEHHEELKKLKGKQ